MPSTKTTGPANSDCLQCHADNAPAVDATVLKKSVHGELACVDCHADIKESPHTDTPGKVACGTCHHDKQAEYEKTVHFAANKKDGKPRPSCASCHGTHEIMPAASTLSKVFWQNIPATCGNCHKDIMNTFNHSMHGKAVATGLREAPVCTDCHGGHLIKGINDKTSSVSPAHIPETCGQCHQTERINSKFRMPNFVVNTYMESYHGLSVQRGSITAANCASCHTNHDILPESDPASSINKNNLVKTCGRCHAGIGAQVMNGKIHSPKDSAAQNKAVEGVKVFYILLFILVLGMMIVHNGLDLIRKMQAHYRHMTSLNRPVRMEKAVRIQHIILVTTFIALAYSGFALKNPQAWWSIPFMGSSDGRGLVHRIAALLFMMLSAYHLWFILFTARGRWHLDQLLPKKADLTQFLQTFAYYFGLRKDKPHQGFYGYIEKMEYWALVWGSVVMALTGLVMMQKETFLKFFPKWLFDAIAAVHYYEAILACLAIILWHWYFVMFDPDVYPMKWTWLNGKSAPADDERKSDEAA
ncbi:MAG: cytochrome b/b6 domain-containing protein [Candidatus Omnitrophica bacterium]|nr:cytochrome b/b6 domain-containing protein [Candidatus Omnitrophota bacterium]